MNLLMSVPESKQSVVEERGVPVLVEIVEAGTKRQKEMGVSILLQLCEESVVYRTMVAREGGIPPERRLRCKSGSDELPGLMPLTMSTIRSICEKTGSRAEI